MSALLQEQMAFMRDVGLLITHLQFFGLEATAGEFWRPPEMQEIYFKAGKSRTLTSNHTRRLAVDLNIFKGPKMATLDEIRPLGEYWESLGPKNRWGGHFTTIKDGPHFERNA